MMSIFLIFLIQIGLNGSLFLFTLPSPSSTSPTIVRRNVGTINYEKGVITLNPINVLSGKIKDGQTIIELSACPVSNDVIGLQDLVFATRY